MADISEVQGNLRADLDSSITDADTSLTVNKEFTSKTVPSDGYLAIGEQQDFTDGTYEVVRYSGFTRGSGTSTFSSLTRGLDNTSASSWNSGITVGTNIPGNLLARIPRQQEPLDMNSNSINNQYSRNQHVAFLSAEESFQSAIDYLESKGDYGKLVIDGDFTVSSKPSFSKSAFWLTLQGLGGADRAGHPKLIRGFDGTFIDIGSTSNYNVFLTIKDLRIDGNKSNYNTGHGILSNVPLLMYNTSVDHFPEDGIHLTNGWYSKFEGVSCSKNDNIGLYGQDLNGVLISGGQFSYNENSSGLELEGAAYKVIGSTIEQNSEGIALTGRALVSAYFENTGHGLTLKDGADVTSIQSRFFNSTQITRAICADHSNNKLVSISDYINNYEHDYHLDDNATVYIINPTIKNCQYSQTDEAKVRLNENQFRTSGYPIHLNLPTTDPLVAGQLWNDSGTVKVSSG